MYMIHMSILRRGVGHFGENCMLQYLRIKTWMRLVNTTMITLALVSSKQCDPYLVIHLA